MKKLIIGVGALALIGAATGLICSKEMGKKEQKLMKKKVINKVESINEAVQQKADKVKDTSADTAKKASLAFTEAQVKNEKVKKDLAAGYKKIRKDIRKTGKNISKDLK